MAAAGYTVLQIDLRGCGDSSGDFGEAGWSDWVDDVLAACVWLREQNQAPLWLWGLRAGCLLATEVARRDEAVTGLEPGQSRSVHIPCEKAYGAVQEDLLFRVEKGAFPFEPEVGMQVRMGLPTGQGMVVTVSGFEEDQVVLDGNHRLAGQDLNFHVTLVEILQA